MYSQHNVTEMTLYLTSVISSPKHLSPVYQSNKKNTQQIPAKGHPTIYLDSTFFFTIKDIKNKENSEKLSQLREAQGDMITKCNEV